MVYKYYQPGDDKRVVRHINSDKRAAALIEEHIEKAKRDQEEKLRLYKAHHPEEFEEDTGEEDWEETEEGSEASEDETQSTEGEETEDGEDSSDFVPGLPVEMLDPDDYASAPPDPSESAEAEAARAYADELINAAKQEAEEIVAAANAEAEAIRTQAGEQGFEEGRQQAEEEMNRVLEEKNEELRQVEEDLHRQHDEAMASLEPEMLDTMLEVFNRVFHIQFDDKKEILSYLVTKTIMNTEGSREFRIKSSPDNFPYLSAHLEEIKAEVSEEYHLEVVSDSALGENRCVIETDGGFFDCSLGVHLESLIKDLKSICLNSI